MSARWFRFYADAMRNPKVAKLSDADFRLWVELLALASENDGHIPPLEDIKHLLRRRLDHLSKGLDRLISASLMDPLEVGYEPHNWNKFQYKSDTSTDRVKKHRQKRNVSETPPDTDTDTEEPKGSPSHNPSPPEKREASKAKKFAMPSDWMPATLPSDVAELVAQWPPGRLEQEVAEFRDYWIEDGTKRPGWDRTFRSRIRTIHNRVMRDSHNDRSQANRGSAPGGYDRRDGLERACDEIIGGDGLDHPRQPPGEAGRFDVIEGGRHRSG